MCREVLPRPLYFLLLGISLSQIPQTWHQSNTALLCLRQAVPAAKKCDEQYIITGVPKM